MKKMVCVFILIAFFLSLCAFLSSAWGWRGSGLVIMKVTKYDSPARYVGVNVDGSRQLRTNRYGYCCFYTSTGRHTANAGGSTKSFYVGRWFVWVSIYLA